MSIQYHIYQNNSAGGPVDYSTIVATVSALTWTSGTLAASSDTTFAVRPFDTATGFENQNVDAISRTVLDASQADITGRPNAPSNLSARLTVSGGVRLDWSYASGGQGGAPVSFLVYLATGSSPSYAGSPVATVAYAAGVSRFSVQLPPATLTDGTTYTAAVRATNAAATEPNTTAVATFVGEVTPPTDVDGLVGVATAQP